MNRSVNVSQGLKKFFFYLFLSGCLGLFGNHYIQKKLLVFWQPVALQLHGAGVELSPPRMVFSRHFLPVLGAQIDSVRFEKEVQCFDGIVTIHNVFVPFSIYQLLSQKLKIGEVDVEDLKIEYIEKSDCAKASLVPQEQAIVEAAEKAIETVEKTDAPAWFRYLDQWFADREKLLGKNPVSSLAIRALSVEARNLEGKGLTAAGKAYFDFKDAASANFNLSSLILRKKERSLNTEFNAQIAANADQVQILGDWAFHGGHFSADLAYTKEQNVKVELKSRDLPVGVVNKWLDTTWSFQFLWFNCEVGLSGKKQEWARIPWSVQSCHMNGPSGDIALANDTLSSLKKPTDLTLKINSLDLDKIIHGRDGLMLSGIFNAFGQLQGQVDLKAGQWQAKFELENPQVVFSSASIRKLQTIDKMNFMGDYNEGVYSLRLLSANIKNGEFDGLISVDYSDRSNSGQGHVDVRKLSFDESIEDLMLAGQVSPLAASGDFSLGPKGHLEKAQGKISFKEFKGTNIELQAVHILAEWAEQKLRLAGGAGTAKIFKNGTARWVVGSLLNKAEGKNTLDINNILFRGLVTVPLLVTLEDMSGSVGPLRLNAKGVYSDKGMEGTWRWLEKDAPIYQWKWRGRKREILLIPQLPKMKEWLKENHEFQRENSYIYVEEKDI
jgi:hypothetical protein